MKNASEPLFYANYYGNVEPVYYVFKRDDEWYAVVGFRGARLTVVLVEELN